MPCTQVALRMGHSGRTSLNLVEYSLVLKGTQLCCSIHINLYFFFKKKTNYNVSLIFHAHFTGHYWGMRNFSRKGMDKGFLRLSKNEAWEICNSHTRWKGIRPREFFFFLKADFFLSGVTQYIVKQKCTLVDWFPRRAVSLLQINPLRLALVAAGERKLLSYLYRPVPGNPSQAAEASWWVCSDGWATL